MEHRTLAYGTVAYGAVAYGTVAYGTVAYGTVAYGACPERKCQIPAQTSLLRSASPSSTLLEDCTSSCIVDCYFWHSPKHPNVCKV